MEVQVTVSSSRAEVIVTTAKFRRREVAHLFLETESSQTAWREGRGLRDLTMELLLPKGDLAHLCTPSLGKLLSLGRPQFHFPHHQYPFKSKAEQQQAA